MSQPPSDLDKFARRNWPWLLIIFGAMVLWYYQGGNLLAGVVGYIGAGWLVWSLLIRPRL